MNGTCGDRTHSSGHLYSTSHRRLGDKDSQAWGWELQEGRECMKGRDAQKHGDNFVNSWNSENTERQTNTCSRAELAS